MSNEKKLEAAEALYSKAQEIVKSYEGREMPEILQSEAEKLFEDSRSLRNEVEKSYTEKKETLKAVRDIPVAEKEVKMTKKSYGLNDQWNILKSFMRGEAGSLEEDQKALLTKSATTTRLADGGALVPEAVMNEIIMRLDDELPLRKAVRTIKLNNSESISVASLLVDATPAHKAEGATISETTLADFTGKQTFHMYRKALLFKVSEEMLDSSVANSNQLLQQEFVRNMAEELENDIINGSGSNEPQGIVPALDNGVAEFSVGATGLTDSTALKNLLGAPYRLKKQYRRNGVYIMGRAAIRALREQLDGDNRPQFSPVYDAMNERISGFPVIESEEFPADSATGDALFVFCDPKQYYLVMREDVSIKRLDELYSAEGKIGFRLTMRYDGAPIDSQAFIRGNRT